MHVKLALCIIDMQEGFVGHLRKGPYLNRACEVIHHTAGLLRAGGHPVIHIRDVEEAESWSPEALAVIPEIRVEEGDFHLEKTHSNAFWETRLAELLQEQEAGLVIVCGFAAEHCVLFTYQGALERGWRAAVLQHGLLSDHTEAVTDTYRFRHTVAYPVIEYILEQAAPERNSDPA
ncbi:cysteine hydrolase family protein [Paenibacillus caseinilyticus]|uniref:Isochorismatase hydrolase n=1 Tax=Paenibacillus mucilaginosus K02 TaxID=997761 RepID=I0BNG2_9BACL|nr:isochorismatase hydrolase [Paenibacillus mucilaginosus K02]